MPIHTIYIEDEEASSPPTQVLEVGLVDNSLFLTLMQYEEDFNKRKLKVVGGKPLSEDHARDYANRAAITVSAFDLLDAIQVLTASELRRHGALASCRSQVVELPDFDCGHELRDIRPEEIAAVDEALQEAAEDLLRDGRPD